MKNRGGALGDGTLERRKISGSGSWQCSVYENPSQQALARNIEVTMGESYTRRNLIRFGVFELDMQTGVLCKNGIRVRCQEQPLQVLAALAERPGELVTREELRRRVWPADTFVDFDRALNTAIKKIRAALNDDADSPRYIETVPRRGYRLIMPVEQGPASLRALVGRVRGKHR